MGRETRPGEAGDVNLAREAGRPGAGDVGQAEPRGVGVPDHDDAAAAAGDGVGADGGCRGEPLAAGRLGPARSFCDVDADQGGQEREHEDDAASPLRYGYEPARCSSHHHAPDDPRHGRVVTRECRNSASPLPNRYLSPDVRRGPRGQSAPTRQAHAGKQRRLGGASRGQTAPTRRATMAPVQGSPRACIPWRVGPRAPCRRGCSPSCATRARSRGPSSPTGSRSRGPRSRPRSTRLAELGLAQEAGPAASRGGRRSTLVDLAAGHPLRRHLDRRHRHVGRGDRRPADRARHPHRPCDIRQGPETVLATALDVVRERARRGRGRPSPWAPASASRARSTSTAGSRCRRRSCRAGTATRSATPSPASSAARSCSTTTSTCSRSASSTPASPGRARDFLFVKIGTGIGCGIVVDGELYRGVDGCAGDIGHIRVDDFGPTCACGNTGCLEAFSGGAALARDATAAARSGRSPALAALLEEQGRAHRRRRRPRRRRRATPRRCS